MRGGHDLPAGSDLLDILGADLDTGGQVAAVDALVAAITLVHDPVAGVLGQYIQVQPHAGLAFGNLPGADRFALGPAHADVGVDSYDAVVLGERGAERAQVGTGGVAAMHAPAGNVDLERLAVVFAAGLLDEKPVIGRQAVVHHLSLRRRPIGDRHAVAGHHRRHGVLGIRGLMRVDLPAGLHAGPAGDAALKIQQGAQGLIGGGGRPGPGNTGGGHRAGRHEAGLDKGSSGQGKRHGDTPEGRKRH